MGTFKEYLVAAATALATAAAFMTIGYSVGKDTNDGLVDFLREKNQIADKTEIQLRAEISSLKLELQSSKSITPTPAVITINESGSDTASASGSVTAKPSLERETERVVLRKGETARPFDDKIIISLVGISFEGDPLRHKIIAAIGAPGKENKIIDKVDVGFALVFDSYEVRVIASDTFSVTFLVTHLHEKR